VQNGMIGAILMRHAPLVRDCVAAMQDACDIDVTVKHRIGVDDMEDYSGLRDFVGTVAESGCKTFIIHARKAWLKGLSPKENRDIPPLDYPLVYRIKRDFPALEIIINGGITTIDACCEHLTHVDGVMLGREAYQNPMILVSAEQRLFGNTHYQPSRRDILERFLPYVETELAEGVALNHITRHILGLYHAIPGGKVFRRTLSQRAHLPESDASLITDAMALAEIAATSPRVKSTQS
jgi:tRNA-dihydrouridine synthase A